MSAVKGRSAGQFREIEEWWTMRASPRAAAAAFSRESGLEAGVGVLEAWEAVDFLLLRDFFDQLEL